MSFQHLLHTNTWGRKFDLVAKKVKGQLTVIIWTNLVDLESSMIYTIFSPKASLVLEKKSFKCFYHIKACGHLVDGAKPFNILAIPFQQKAPSEIWWKLIKRFQRRRQKLHNFIHVYSLGARADTPQGTKFWFYLKCFTTLTPHCKFQPLAFNTFWENDFSTFSPYKCMGMQIWPCRKRVKGQPKVIIWTNLVDLESLMLYTKNQS